MMKKGNDSKRFGLGGILEGLGSLVDGLGELMEKVEAEGGELRREGTFEPRNGKEGPRAVYGFSMRMGVPGARPRMEPFGNLRPGKRGETIVAEHREPLVDVFEEPDAIVVVAEMPGVREDELQLRLEGDVLVVRAEGTRNRYHKEVLLPCRAASHTSNLRNGILEVRLVRETPSV